MALSKDSGNDDINAVRNFKGMGCGALIGYVVLFFASLAFINVTWTMIAPLVVGKKCDLAHTNGKKSDLDVMAEGLSQSLFELKQADLSQL